MGTTENESIKECAELFNIVNIHIFKTIKNASMLLARCLDIWILKQIMP